MEDNLFQMALAIKNGTKRIDVITKISENLAFINRDKFINQMGYNYTKDNDFIFLDEMRRNQKLKDAIKIKMENAFKKKTKINIILLKIILMKQQKERKY